MFSGVLFICLGFCLFTFVFFFFFVVLILGFCYLFCAITAALRKFLNYNLPKQKIMLMVKCRSGLSPILATVKLVSIIVYQFTFLAFDMELTM